MEQKDDEPPQFWLQSTTTLGQVDQHHRQNRQASSLFLNTGVLVIVLLIAAIIFLVIVIPYILSLAKQVFNPSLVKSSWSSLNIVLVLFAIVCGFLSRNQDEQITPVNTPTRKHVYKPELNPSQWYGYQDRGGYSSFGNVENVTRLRRSSNSYPDLRLDSPWIVKESNSSRFYDDTDVENIQFQRSDSQVSRTRSFRKMDGDENVDQVDVQNVEVNKQEVLNETSPKDLSPSPSVIDVDESGLNSGSEAGKNVEFGNYENVVEEARSTSFAKDNEVGSFGDSVDQDQPKQTYIPPPSPTSYYSPSPSPPPPPPPPATRRQSSNQTFETIGYGRYKWNDNNSTVPEPKIDVQLPPSSSPPPARSQDRDRKRGGVTVTKDFFTSFYHQSKRKRKHKRRSYETLEEFIEPYTKATINRSKSTPEFPPPSPPPPPPPPLPNSVFHNLFTKKGKTKTPKTKPKFPPPKKSVKKIVSFSLTTDDENVSAEKVAAVKGNESPMIPIPPPPPFEMKPWRFSKQGDYVKMESNNDSPRSGYYASEDGSISPSSAKTSQTSTPTAKTSLFCPSPDVNMKADDFIAKFRAKLTLEKSDSINLKQGTGSGTGPSRLRLDSI